VAKKRRAENASVIDELTTRIRESSSCETCEKAMINRGALIADILRNIASGKTRPGREAVETSTLTNFLYYMHSRTHGRDDREEHHELTVLAIVRHGQEDPMVWMLLHGQQDSAAIEPLTEFAISANKDFENWNKSDPLLFATRLVYRNGIHAKAAHTVLRLKKELEIS
jgi:hypothetical protein